MDELKRQARQAYEWARLRSALPWALVGVALGAIAVWRGAPHAGGFAGVLAMLLVWLRWRGQDIGRAVIPGLAAGSLGYAAPLIYAAQHGCCAGSSCSDACTMVCAVGGLGTGLLLARAVIKGPQALGFAVAVSAVAGMTAAVGCTAMGWVGLVGVAVGWAVSAPVVVFRQVQAA